MNLFNFIKNKKMSGMIMPAAVALTFGTMMLTVGYMERVLNKKINLDIRIAKTKARLNAESGVAISIAGPTDDGEFMPSIASASWPSLDEGVDAYDVGIVDKETFPGYYQPEKITTFFPNAGIPNTSEIDMGQFYDIRLMAYSNEDTRRPERSAVAYGRAYVINIWGDSLYVIDSSEVKYTVEVLSDFLYLTHHEKAGGAPGIFGETTGPFSQGWERRQPCFGPDDGFGNQSQNLVGFVQTLDPMQICSACTPQCPTFDNMIYITKATDSPDTDPPNWIDWEQFNITGLDEGDSIMPDWSTCSCDDEDILLGDGGPDIHPAYEVRDPVCFPLEGYKTTVLSARSYDTYDATTMLRRSNGNTASKDTLIMTDIEFLDGGGYRVKRWWYLLPPYLRSDVLTCGLANTPPNINATCGSPSGLPVYQYPYPHNLEGMPAINPTINVGGAFNVINGLCEDNIINNATNPRHLFGDITKCDPYEDALHDFSSLKVIQHNSDTPGNSPTLDPSTYDEEFNIIYSNQNVAMNNGEEGGVTRLSHYDIENFTNSPQNTGVGGNDGYFQNKGWFTSKDWDLELPYSQGGNLLSDDFKSHPEGSQTVIYVKGGPVRVHGEFDRAYTVVTSGWDEFGGNNCLDPGCSGYDGYSTYFRHAHYGTNVPLDTIPTNIWLVGDLVNADASGNAGPPQPEVINEFTNEIICNYDSPGDCGGSDNIMGLVSAANVVIANSPDNRTGGINIHASIAALNESFVMHYWQHVWDSGCPNNQYPFNLNTSGNDGDCSQNPPQADNRGRGIYWNNPGQMNGGLDGRGVIRLWGGIIQKYRGYMNRQITGPYVTPGDIGMDKGYNFDNNLYFPPPGAITINECKSNTVRISMIDYGRPKK